MSNRRNFLSHVGAAVAGGALASSLKPLEAAAATHAAPGRPVPVVTPNGSSLPYTMEGGWKVFHLVAEPVKRELTPGFLVNCWGYNGQTPGPTIEVFEGDKVRIFVTNKLREKTSVHWHGVLLPNGMDGVTGLTQKGIQPGQTYRYEFVIDQPAATLMYHPHSDEMTQMAMGMMGFFIIHPRVAYSPTVDRDFAIFLAEWDIKPGTATPNPFQMTDFNYFTFNAKCWPGTDPLVVRQGQRVRIRYGNLTMDSHPIHLHGYVFHHTGTTGGRIPQSAWMPDDTVNVPVGSTRDIEFVADRPGDWALHCHKVHHTMNGMVHDLPVLLGVKQDDVGDTINKVVPGYMPMGDNGMADMDGMDMGRPRNTVPMATQGPYDYIEMGGMFTVLKVRSHLTSYADPGWYQQPHGTAATLVSSDAEAAPVAETFTCPMHPDVVSTHPGKCPRCGMTLVPRKH